MPKGSQSNSSSSGSQTAASRYGRVSRASHGGPASFAECHPEELGSAIDLVIATGDLVSFSRTSDGGAVCVFIKSAGETMKFYAAGQEELAALVHDLSELPEG